MKRLLNNIRQSIEQHPFQTALIIVLLIVSLAIRLHLSLTTPLNPGNTDPTHYHNEVMNFFSGKGITSVYWPPGYPFFLIPFYAIFGKTFITAKVLNTILSLLNAGIVYYLGKKLFNHTVGLIGFFWMLLDPLLTFYATNVYTETLFIALSMGSLALMFWQQEQPKLWKPIVIGAMIGFAALIKPWVLVLSLIILAWWLLQATSKKEKKKQKAPKTAAIKQPLLWFGLLLVFMIIALLPWGFKNQQTHGHFTVTPINGPTNFYLGNHEYGTLAFTSAWPEETWVPFEGKDDWQKADIANEISKAYVADDFGGFIGRVLQRFFKYWSHPNLQWYQRLLTHSERLIGYLWIKWTLGLIGIAYSLKQWKKHSASYLFWGLMTGVFCLTLYLARFKVPLFPLQFIYAGAGIMLISNIIKQAFRSSKEEA